MQYLYNIGSRVYNAVASIPADISRRLFRGVLNELLGPYLKDKLQLENLDTHFGDGVFTFRDLVLEEDMINKKLGGVKLTCRFARIDCLTVSAPYDLGAGDLNIEAQGVTLVMSTSRDSDLFRSAFSSAGGSMMQSVFVPREEDEGQQEEEEEQEEEGDERPKVESNVYMELQENIADLLESLRARLVDCRVLIENNGHVFELEVRRASLVDTRRVDTYTIGPDDSSFASIAAKLGVPSLSLPLPPFAVGEVVRVPSKVEGLTCSVAQKWFRFLGLFVNYLGKVPLGLGQSGAGEDLLETLEARAKLSVLSFGASDDESSLLLELSDDQRIWCNLVLRDEQAPVAVTVTEEICREVLAVVRSVMTVDDDDDEDGEKDAVLRSGVLSDFSIMYHQQQRSESVIGNGPLKFASVFSDWSLLKSYADSSLLRCSLEMPLFQMEFRDEHAVSVFSMRQAKMGIVSANKVLQWTVELDGGLAFAEAEAPLLSIFPSALPLSVKGEMDGEDAMRRKIRLAVEHCPPVAVSSLLGAALSRVGAMVATGAASGSSVGKEDGNNATSTTVKLEWKQFSVLLDQVYDLSCSDVCIVMESASSVRLLMEASSLELRMGVDEVVSAKQCRLGLFWKSGEQGGAAAAAASSVSPVNDASSLISVPFEGISAIWGAQSAGLKLTQTFVSSFSEIARTSNLHLDFGCESLVANCDQAKADSAILWMRQPAAAPLLWTSWAVAVRGDCVIALLHESLARHDYCWSGLSMFGCVALEQKDCGFVMLNSKRAQVFVSNPRANLPRALLWQKLSSAPPQSQLDEIELSNLKTCLVLSRLSVSRVADVRIVVRSVAISPVSAHWQLASDFFGGPDLAEEEDDEEEDAREEKWMVQAEPLSVLMQSSSAHAVLCLESLGAIFSRRGSRAWQLSLDVGPLKLFVCNRDTLPPGHRYLDAAQYVQEKAGGYRQLAALGGCNVGLMKDESIAVNLINFQGHVLDVRSCSDSLATAIVLGKNWSAQLGTEPVMGVPRVRDSSRNENSMMEASVVLPPPAKAAAAAMDQASAPTLAVVRTAHLEVHMFLLELREEFKVQRKKVNSLL